jgi:hypothetical protein
MPDIIYYFYHNPNRNPHLTIHKSTCGHCKFGGGKHTKAEKGLNSVWTGPFYDLKWVEDYINDNIRKDYPTEFCKHCFT